MIPARLSLHGSPSFPQQFDSYRKKRYGKREAQKLMKTLQKTGGRGLGNLFG
jgi:hypothetical protein